MVPAEVGPACLCGSVHEPGEEVTHPVITQYDDILQAKYDEALKEIRRLRHIIHRAGNELDEAYS